MSEDRESNSQVQWKDAFLKKLRTTNHYKVFSKNTCDDIIADVIAAKIATKKTPQQYRRLHRFDVFEIAGTYKLTAKTADNDIKYYVPEEEMFEIIRDAHIATGHGGRDRLISETSKKYANITREMICLFLSMCEVCQQKKVKRKRGLVSKPILHTEMNSRCQLDLIDYQTQADGNFKFVMVYQDHLTKFVFLRALKTKTAEEVAYNLLDIFLIIGAPCILHSDNGREFVNKVIEEIALMWPELKIVHGKPRHSQSQGSVERANQDIENMIAVWMKDNNTSKWSEGLRFIQFTKNRAFHSGIRQCPYKAMFGFEPRVGLTTTKFPSDVLKNILTETDLEELLETVDTHDHVIETESIQSETEQNNIQGRDLNNQENLGESHVTVVEETESDVAPRQTINNDDQGHHLRVARKRAAAGLAKQAKRMKKTSDKLHPAAETGDNVAIPIPAVDKAKSDLRNLLGVVLEINDDGLYKIGTNYGILNKLYCRSEFDTCTQKFLSEEDVLADKLISLRSAAMCNSNTTGQGYVRCNCRGSCDSNKCLCKKKKILCNSKCHNSTTCKNKN